MEGSSASPDPADKVAISGTVGQPFAHEFITSDCNCISSLASACSEGTIHKDSDSKLLNAGALGVFNVVCLWLC